MINKLKNIYYKQSHSNEKANFWFLIQAVGIAVQMAAAQIQHDVIDKQREECLLCDCFWKCFC